MGGWNNDKNQAQETNGDSQNVTHGPEFPLGFVKKYLRAKGIRPKTGKSKSSESF
jgi:hypothetical protein